MGCSPVGFHVYIEFISIDDEDLTNQDETPSNTNSKGRFTVERTFDIEVFVPHLVSFLA